jgi:hypothetical protein
MMHFTGFKSKKDLVARIKDKSKPALVADEHFVETSIFGPELRPNGTFCVCMDHPKRSKFANITVKDGLIVGAR